MITYEDKLGELARDWTDVVVMTAENRAMIRNLPELLGPRFIDVGICEQTLVAAASGLALRGRRPVVHALAAFLSMRAFEFVRTDVGLTNLPVTLIGFVPGVLSDANGPTHQAIEDLALMRMVPNMQVVCPADREELVAALPVILESRRPCYVRYNASEPAEGAEPAVFELGRAQRLGNGDDVAILTFGRLTGEALDAQRKLAAQGIAARVVNLRSLAPLDEDAVCEALSETRLSVTLEDHFIDSGLYGTVCKLAFQRGIRAHVVPIGFDRRPFVPATLDVVLDREGLSGARVAQTIADQLERQRV